MDKFIGTYKMPESTFGSSARNFVNAVGIPTSPGYSPTSSNSGYSGLPANTPFSGNQHSNTRVQHLDEDGRIGLGNNNIHIQPTNNGFMVTTGSMDEGLKVLCFNTFSEVIEYVADLGIMTLDDERVADNV